MTVYSLSGFSNKAPLSALLTADRHWQSQAASLARGQIFLLAVRRVWWSTSEVIARCLSCRPPNLVRTPTASEPNLDYSDPMEGSHKVQGEGAMSPWSNPVRTTV